MTENKFPKLFHVLKSGLAVPVPGDEFAPRIAYRGEEFEVTEAIYERSKDRNGKSWLDLSPEEQVARWGVQRFAEGPAPEGMGIGTDDSTVMYRRRENAIMAANKLSDPADRQQAFKAIRDTYGNGESSQRTLRSFDGTF